MPAVAAAAAGHAPAIDIMRPLHTAAEALAYDSEHKLRQENLPFDIDVWYPPLQQFTFKTTFIPLRLAEAKAVVRFYRARYMEGELPRPDLAVLGALEVRLDAHVKAHYSRTGCFLRLCGRSAKDAEPVSRRKVREDFLERLDEAAAAGLDVGTPEAKMWAVRVLPRTHGW